MEVGSEKWQRRMVDLHRQWATSRRRVSLQLKSLNDGGYLTRFTAVLKDLPLSVQILALNPNIESLIQHADGIQALLQGLVKREVPASDWLMQGVAAIGIRGSTGPVLEFLTACAPLFKQAAQVLGIAVPAEVEPRNAPLVGADRPPGRINDDVSALPANVGREQISSAGLTELVTSDFHSRRQSSVRIAGSNVSECGQDYQTTEARKGGSACSSYRESEEVQFWGMSAQEVTVLEESLSTTQIQLREQKDLTRQLSEQMHQLRRQLADAEEKAHCMEDRGCAGREGGRVVEELQGARGAVEALRVMMMGQEQAKEVLVRQVSALQDRLVERDRELEGAWAVLQEYFTMAGEKYRENLGRRGKDGGRDGDGSREEEGWECTRGGAKVRRVEPKLADVVASLMSELGNTKEGLRVAESRLAQVQVASGKAIQVAALSAEVHGLRREARLSAQAVNVVQTSAEEAAFSDKTRDTGAGIAWQRLVSLQADIEGAHTRASQLAEGLRKAEKLCSFEGVKAGAMSPVRVTRWTPGKDMGSWAGNREGVLNPRGGVGRLPV